MTNKDWLKQAITKLKNANLATAELDVQVLLADELDMNRAQILAHPEKELSEAQVKKLDAQIKRRLNHEPLAYIRGKIEFYGEEFFVDKRVLVPRPETETMIDELKKLEPSMLFDVGTGSGAIAIIAKKLFPSKEVIAVDNDPGCLSVARKNAEKHDLAIAIRRGDLLESTAIPDGAVVLANLPYVPNDFGINKAALNEPHQAIFGGKDGFDLYRRLFAQLRGKKATVLAESLPPQHSELAQIARSYGFEQSVDNDFIQVFVPGNL